MREHFFWGGFMKKTQIFISLFAFVTCILLSNNLYADSSESVVNEGHSHEDVKRGERFFKGLLPFDREYSSCVSCHNLNRVDTLNWNPSAMDIAIKYVDKDFESFQASVMNPVGIKMEASHVNFDISEEDLKTVKVYLDNLAHTGVPPAKPTHYNLILFLFLGLLITWAVVELIFIRKIKLKFIPLIILLGAFGWQVKMIVTDAIKLGRQENYAPDQPIKFSHKVHAGENGIDCMYCHTTVEQSKSAGIPATNLCMNCHILIREGTNSGKFEIAKVVDAAENGHSIEWKRIHNLPDHVYFSHAVHVGSGKLDCMQCHGPVEEMDIMEQHSDLSMGWCVNCHRDTEVDFGNNGYYEHYVKLHEEMKSGAIDSVKAVDIGANDCMRCHY
ncbi:cytochrome c3 family protein [uncultured Draconibacterium sp.]|uniref:cytochrome c3 family protein n=1 Tax=uncultured Draconibacterium sp. TaxID=1573823 RepID=UPI0029C6A168|nr:cytochrome c3 family protein [uncultured Draconibacterium sp.]